LSAAAPDRTAGPEQPAPAEASSAPPDPRRAQVREAVLRPSRARLWCVAAEGMVRILTGIVLAVLAWILLTLLGKGAGTISWDYLTTAPEQVGAAGGIGPALFGTAFLILFMIVLALPVGVGGAVYLVEYSSGGWLSRLCRAAVTNLAGVPSIVFGLFGLGFFVLFVGGTLDRLAEGPNPVRRVYGQGGMLWAAATLAVLVLPIIIVSTEEALKAVPRALREGAYALGASRWQMVRTVVLPQAMPGILTGAILAVSRGAGELAPVLFVGVAFLRPELPLTEPVDFGLFEIPVVNPFEPFMHLTYHVFTLATQGTNPEATRPMQYGATLVLLALVVMLNTAAIWLRNRSTRKGP
jgi:phosphate transport system permease protein